MKTLSALFACACLLAGAASAADLTGNNVWKLVVDPSTPSTIYATYGAPVASGTGAGVYKSTDAGITWTLIYPDALAPLDIELDPQNPSTLYVAVGDSSSSVAIAKSTDGGSIWSEADAGITRVPISVHPPLQLNPDDWVGAIAVDPVHEGTLYAVHGVSGLFKSTDGGQSWTSIDGGLDTLTGEMYIPLQLIVDPVMPDVVYFNLSADFFGSPKTVPSGLYKSTDGGATWNATALAGMDTPYLAVDPENHQHLVACANLVRYSTDGGATWLSSGYGCGPGDLPGQAAIAIDPANPSHVLVGAISSSGYAPIRTSSDGGKTFMTSGVAGLSVIYLAFDPIVPNNVYAGTQTGAYISRDGGVTWNPSASAPARVGIIHVPADQPTIQAGIDAASAGYTVLVAPGTYREQLDFKGKAITVKSSGGAAVTILDGQDKGPIVDFHGGETSASVLQGFTFTHAKNTDSFGFGPAVFVTGSSPLIEDNVFVDNVDLGGIGGAAIGGTASPSIIRNYFTGNVTSSPGPTSACVVSFENQSSPLLADNVFVNNALAAYCQGLPAIASLQVYNNTMVGNTAGLVLGSGSDVPGRVVSNNLIAFNQVGIQASFSNGQATMPPFVHNLVYGNTTANYLGIADQTGIDGNLSADPILSDWQQGDVRPLTGSPVIDTGDSTVTQLSVTDFYGANRLYNATGSFTPIVDIGAAEYYPPSVSANDGSISTSADTEADGSFQWTVSGSSAGLVFALVTQGAHGTVVVTDQATGAFSYTPGAGYVGPDSFSFEIKDGSGFVVSNIATVQATVGDLNPGASGGSATTKADTTVTGIAPASAAYAGQVLSYSVVTPPAHGKVALGLSTGRYNYVPANGFVGTDSFTFDVHDAYGAMSNVSTVSITVTGEAAKASAGIFALLHSSTRNGALGAVPAYGGQVLHFSVVSLPTHGVTVVNTATGTFTYTPKRGYKGKDSFSFKVTDQWGVPSNVATVSITVL